MRTYIHGFVDRKSVPVACYVQEARFLLFCNKVGHDISSYKFITKILILQYTLGLVVLIVNTLVTLSSIDMYRLTYQLVYFRNPFNILILSLSISDFFSALNSPLQIYRSLWGYLEFNLPVGVCKVLNSEKLYKRYCV